MSNHLNLSKYMKVARSFSLYFPSNNKNKIRTGFLRAIPFAILISTVPPVVKQTIVSLIPSNHFFFTYLAYVWIEKC